MLELKSVFALGVTENCCEWKREGLGAGAVVVRAGRLKTFWDDDNGTEVESETVGSEEEPTMDLRPD